MQDADLQALYSSRPYLEAYAEHTDQRVLKDPHAAVGGQWETIGRLQFDFLVTNGLKPASTLLDIGCGTLRGGRHFIRYLDPGKYTGTDISIQAIEYGRRLIQTEHLSGKTPTLIHRGPTDSFFSGFADASFDFILAQSVFTHLPGGFVERCMGEVGRLMRKGGVFFFTFWDDAEHRQKGLKDFTHPASFFSALADRYGFVFRLRDDYRHPRKQSMGELRRRE